MAPKQHWRHLQRFGVLKNRNFRIGDVSLCPTAKRKWSDFRFDTPGKLSFPNPKQIAISLNQSNFEAFFCVLAPSKTNITNRKEIAFLLRGSKLSVLWRSEKANYPNAKEIAFSWRQNNLDEHSSILVHSKIEFSKPETKIDSSCRQTNLKQFSVFWRHEKASFPNPNEIAFSWCQKTLTRFPAFWCPERR
jgi:hypothetical protein